MKYRQNDTIIALATAPSQAAIAVIRLSGDRAIALVDEVFHGKNLGKVEGNTVHYGKIKDENGKVLDECLATVFRAPRSYTREDVVEISCHGSMYIADQVIQLLIRQGARQAEPGEFTLRAFLNGQLDLSQAEAVAELIASESQATHELAMKQMRGGFSHEIKELRQELIDFAALVELELDFSEEDVEFADRSQMVLLVQKIQEVLSHLIQSFQLGNVLKQGVATVIAGRPNAGKSTLLNALLNEERAIVSEIAGTTRDTIEEVLNIGGVRYRLIDTAGIREAQDTIEEIGVQRTMEKIAESTLLLYVFDITETTATGLWQDLEIILKRSADQQNKIPSNLLVIANKMDLNPYTKPEDYYRAGLIDKSNLITASAKLGMNLPYIKEKLYELVVKDPQLMDQTIVSNSRHYDALYKARASLQAVEQGIAQQLSGDLLAMDIRQALHYLGEITGEIHTDDLLESIFSRFCIGK